MSDLPCPDVAALTLGDDAPTGTIIEPPAYGIRISEALMARYITTKPDGDCLYHCFIGIASVSKMLKELPTDAGRPFTVLDMRKMIADEMLKNAGYYIPNYWESDILPHMLKHRVVRSGGNSGRDGWRFTQTYLNECVRMTPDMARAEGSNPEQTWGGMVEIDAFAQLTGLVVRVYTWASGVFGQAKSPTEARLAFIAKPRNEPEGDPVVCNLVQSATHFEYIQQEPGLEVFHYATRLLRADDTRPPIRKADDPAPPPYNRYDQDALRADGMMNVGLISRARGQQQQPGQPAAPVVDPEAAKRVKEEQAKDIADRRKREKEKDVQTSSWIVAGARSEASGPAQGPRRHYRSIAEIHRRARERQATEDDQYMQLVVAVGKSKQPRQ